MNQDGPTGIVLAGGAGSRLGVPKATALLGDVTLAARALATLAPRCTEVIVVTRPEIAMTRLDARVVFDRPGPASAIVALATGLAAARTGDCLVLGCDLPLAAAVFDRLPPGGGIAADPQGRAQPLCARYPRQAALDACEALIASGRLALQGLVATLGLPVIPATALELLNINTPADLAQAAAHIGRSSTTAL